MTVREIEAGDVELAMLEADELGRGAFLEKYGFRHATTYLVRHEGRFYDPKALAGVAHGFRGAQQPLGPNEFDPGWVVLRWMKWAGLAWSVGAPRGDAEREDLARAA